MIVNVVNFYDKEGNLIGSTPPGTNNIGGMVPKGAENALVITTYTTPWDTIQFVSDVVTLVESLKVAELKFAMIGDFSNCNYIPPGLVFGVTKVKAVLMNEYYLNIIQVVTENRLVRTMSAVVGGRKQGIGFAVTVEEAIQNCLKLILSLEKQP